MTTVSFTIPERPLGRENAEFHISIDGEKLGRLKISNGDLEWWPNAAKKGYHISWADFNTFALAKGEKR